MTNVAHHLAEVAAGGADRTAIKLDHIELTYGALDAASAAAADLLRSLGVKPGDRVGLMAPNVPYFGIAYYAILRAGAVVVPMNVLLTERETASHLSAARATAMFAWHECAAAATAGAVAVGASCILVEPGQFERLLDAYAPADRSIDPREPDDTSALEVGGTSACVVLDDADLELAVTSCVVRCLLNCGQTCVALTRLLVPRERLAEAGAIAATVAEAHVLGDPLDPATQMGPLVSAGQRSRVHAHIRRALLEGARLVTGGTYPPRERGYFVAPTVLSGVRTDMSIAHAEVFGPVLSIFPYDGEEDAIQIVNDARFGLSGAVWSGDEERALRIARRLRTAHVDINGGASDPFARFGVHGLNEFVCFKSIQR